MKNTKKFAAAGALVAQSLIGSMAWAEMVEVSFILTNDVDQMTVPDGRGGLDKVLAVVAAERAEKGDNALFIHAGDAFGPSLMSRFDQGAHIVDLLNLQAPDVFVPGNHEFDFGEDVFRQRIEDSNFPVLAANLTHPQGLMAGIVPSRIVDIDGVKIGFVGAIEEDTAELSEVGAFALSPALDAAVRAANDLREQGVDFVVAVMSTSSSVDREAVQSKAFDLLLSGDDHDLVAFYNGVTAYAESASQGDYVVVVDVVFDVTEGSRGRNVAWHPNFRIIDTKNVAPLPEATEIVARLDENLSEELDVVLLTLPTVFETTKALVRTEETAMGNLIADGVRYSTNVDVALVNSGSIRGNRSYEPGHELSSRDVLTELPFGNRTFVVEVSGTILRDALENAVSQLEDKAGRFLQVSGVSFEYDPAADAGSRVTSAMVGSGPLEDTVTYKVAINNYLYAGGDGFSMFEGTPLIVGEVGADTVTNQVIAYLQSGQVQDASVGTRITALHDASTTVPPVAAFSSDLSGLTATFADASSDDDGEIVTWFWDFGDGSTSTDQNPVHSYAFGGVFEATLTVNDASGQDASTAETIEVLASAGEITSRRIQVAESHDDVEEKVSDGVMYMDSSDLELVNDDHVGGDQIVGMRFQSVDIPQGAEITSASLTFGVDELDSVATNLEILGQTSGNADPFTDAAFNVSSRTTTDAVVTWEPAPWASVETPQITPDLTAIVQEIVNRDDWSAGNSVVLIVRGTGLRTAASFDGDPSAAPDLNLTFVVPQ